jgi:hypothetical protein
MADAQALWGVWELVALEVERDGVLEPWGRNARGLLMYWPTGQMSVGLRKDPDSGSATANSFASSIIFYSGTYELRGAEMLHRAEISSDPARFTNVRRRVEIDGDALTLLTTPGEIPQARLRWRRLARA